MRKKNTGLFFAPSVIIQGVAFGCWHVTVRATILFAQDRPSTLCPKSYNQIAKLPDLSVLSALRDLDVSYNNVRRP